MIEIKNAKRIIAFVESLSREELGFLRSISGARTEKEIIGRMKTKRRGRRHNRYTDQQIRKAFELRSQQISRKETEKLTGVKASSLSNPQWLKERFEALMEKIPKNGKIRTY